MKHPFYPFLIAILPPLFLHAINIQQVHSLASWRLVLGSLLLAVAIWLPLWPWLRRFERVRRLTRPLNTIGLVAVGIQVLAIAWTGLPRDLRLPHAVPARVGPDHYFIVLDSYTSHQVLLERFGYDDSPFLDGLARLGFSTGSCISPAEYTLPALSAMLNEGAAVEQSADAILHSSLRRDLEAQGYVTWAFASGWAYTEMRDAARYFQPPPGPLTVFEAWALGYSPLAPFIDLSSAQGEQYRQRTYTVLAHLPDAVYDPGSQFVFAHITQPHPPFVFDADGNPTDWSVLVNPAYIDQAHKMEYPEYLTPVYNRGYVAQVEYIGKAILPVLADILQRSGGDVYISIRGDHGPWYSTPAEALQTMCAEWR